ARARARDDLGSRGDPLRVQPRPRDLRVPRRRRAVQARLDAGRPGAGERAGLRAEPGRPRRLCGVCVRPAAREAAAPALTLGPVGDLDDVRAGLDRLAGAGGNVFGTWEFLATGGRHFGGGRPLRTLASADAILPLYLWRSAPVRVLRFAGHGAGDELGPVGLP